VCDYVIFTGYVSEEEINCLMQVADIVIFPYEKWTSAMSGALCHAISASKPIICTDIPAFEILENGKNCLKIVNKDVKKGIILFATLLLTNKKLCRKLSFNLSKLRANFSIQSFAKKYMQLISTY
jgi:glycosyltransferase involved in cell wall biosynthesis